MKLSDNNNPNENLASTPLSNKIEILSDLWIHHKNSREFEDFVEYNDLGLPLAYLINSGIVSVTPKAQMFIEETWELFLAGLEVEDTGFGSLEELLGTSE